MTNGAIHPQPTLRCAMTIAKRRVLLLLLILLMGAAPLISVTIAGIAASLNDCRLDEAAAYPCVIAGHDFGELLSTMSVAGWFGLVTLPAAISLIFCWGVWLALRLLLRKRRSATPPSRAD